MRPRLRRFSTLAMLFVAVTVAPQARAAAGCEDLSGRPIAFGVRWPEVWQALTDGASCTQNCHIGSSPSAELDLGSATLSIFFLVNQPSSFDVALLRVRPGDPKRSLFLQKVNCSQPDAGSRMPPGGHLPIELQELIYDWIEQGALGEGREDPIAREFIFRDSLESTRR